MAATLTASGLLTSDSSPIYSSNFNGVGSYVITYTTISTIAAGATIAAGSGASQVQSTALYWGCYLSRANVQNNLSGTWRNMGATNSGGNDKLLLCVRIA